MDQLGISELLIVTLTCICLVAGGAGVIGLFIWLASRRNKEFEENLAEFEQYEE
jgi:hypothetical protein